MPLLGSLGYVSPGMDQGILAVRDDGSQTGIMSAELKRMGLVYMPFRRGGELEIINNGGSYMSVQSATGINQYSQNGDGSGSMLLCNIAASATYNSYAQCGFWFAGNIFGLRYDTTASDVTNIGVMIDRISYPVLGKHLLHPATMEISYATPYAYNEILARDLGDGMHYAEIIIPCKLTSTSIARIWGYVVDSAAGYKQQESSMSIGSSQIILGTTNAYLTNQSQVTIGNLMSVRAIKVINTTGAAIMVTLNTAIGSGWDIETQSIAAGLTGTFDMCASIGDITSLRMRASAVGCTATLIGKGYSV